MSLVFVFAVVWIGVLAAWMLLDWLGDANRGSFRPQRERPTSGATRQERRQLRRNREDAEVRAVLRDRFGRSSLRLQWSDDEEVAAIDADQDLVTASHSAAGLDQIAAEPEPPPTSPTVELYDGRGDEPEDEVEDHSEEVEDHSEEVEDDQLTEEEATEPDPTPEPEPEPGPEPETETEPTSTGWTIGDDPLSPTRRGSAPSATAVRSRVWKNLGAIAATAGDVWTEENRERMRSGKPPRRHNPITRRTELASVDPETGIVAWPDSGVDPYTEPET